MKIENFTILVRAEGVTSQVVLTAAQQRLFSKQVIGSMIRCEGYRQNSSSRLHRITGQPESFPPVIEL